MKPSAPVGMAAIAQAAGVSVSTVSRALSGLPGVSDAKRAEILELARRFGYVADERGHRSDRRGEPVRGRITAVIPEPDRWVFGSILAGLHDVLTSDGPSLTVYSGLSATERARIIDSPTFIRETDVVVLSPLPRDISVERLHHLGVPVVVANSVVPGLASVGIDDPAVGRQATNYLINTGYRRIALAYYSDHEGTSGVASQKRREGFMQSMEREGLDPSWQVEVSFGPDAGRAAAQQLLAGDQLPEAIVVASDEMAAGMMSVFRLAGVRIPDDLALIGVDDHPVADLVRLTTIAQPAREQGRVAARLALQALAGVLVTEPIVLPTRLIVRESTARAPRQGSTPTA